MQKQQDQRKGGQQGDQRRPQPDPKRQPGLGQPDRFAQDDEFERENEFDDESSRPTRPVQRPNA